MTSVIVNKQLFTTEGNSPVSTFEISGNTISQTEEELFADVPVDGEVLTENDLTPGDYWLFSYELVLDNGRTVEPGGRTRVLLKLVVNLVILPLILLLNLVMQVIVISQLPEQVL